MRLKIISEQNSGHPEDYLTELLAIFRVLT